MKPLAPQIQKAIVADFDCPYHSEGYSELLWRDWMMMIYILTGFYCLDSIETPQFQEVLRYHDFVRAETEKRNISYPSAFEEYPVDKLRRILNEKGDIEKSPQRPRCVECGSSHVVSNGACWMCRECGRQWIKRPIGKKVGQMLSH